MEINSVVIKNNVLMMTNKQKNNVTILLVGESFIYSLNSWYKILKEKSC